MSVILDHPETTLKTYWSIINSILNTNKKIHIIPTIFGDGKLTSDFQKKANLFKNHFTSLCTPVKNFSRLPNVKCKTD